MEIFTLAGLLAIGNIIIIDILLAGDNAVVIGMAARNLPENLQKKAIFLGTFGAIVLRLIMAFLFVEALDKIPYLRLVGGLLLIWIGYKLLLKEEKTHDIKAKDNLLGAISTIVIADGIMSIDNVLGVVAAAKGHLLLVMFGMLFTVPIIIWGSTIFIKLIEKYPIILYGGGAILGWVAASMIIDDTSVNHILEPFSLLFHVGCMVIILVAAIIVNKLNANSKGGQGV